MPSADRRFEEGDHEAAVAAVVRAGEHRATGACDEEPEERSLLRGIDRGWLARHDPEDGLGELRPSERGESLTRDVDRQPGPGERARDPQPVVLEEPEHPDHGCRPDRALTALVVEAHVAPGH